MDQKLQKSWKKKEEIKYLNKYKIKSNIYSGNKRK